MSLATPYATSNTAKPMDDALVAMVTATDAITAFAGGGQASATLLASRTNRITVCASIADSVKLPPALVGMWCVVVNSGAASANVFPATGETINAGAANAAAAQAAGLSASFHCPVAGKWFRILSA